MNIIQIMGNLGRDPETRYTESGQKVTSFAIASNSKRKGKEETVWIRVTVWGDRFDRLLQYIKKGSLIMVVGELHKPELYTDRNGVQQISLEMTAEMIRFLPGKKDRGQEEGGFESSSSFASSSSAPQTSQAVTHGSQEIDFGEDSHDDIPF